MRKTYDLLPKQQRLISQLAENLVLARKRRKLTAKQVSERAGISRNTLYLLESGKGNTSLQTLYTVLNVYGMLDDITKLAADDKLGRTLQDIDLLIDQTDPIDKYKNLIWGKIHSGLKSGSFDRDTEDVVGKDVEGLIKHFDNNIFGFKYGDPDLDIDHIKPISSGFSIKSIETLNHFSNLQLLPSTYNQNVKIDRSWDLQKFIDWLDAR